MNEYLDLVTFSKEYLEFMKKVKKNNHDVNISTITLLCTLNVKKVDIEQFSKRFKVRDVQMRHASSNKDYEVTKRGKIKKTFYNQITVNYKDISKKSVKIFSNGKLQITGLSCYWECHHVIEMVLRWLNGVFTNIKVTDAYIGMMNSNFSLGQGIDLNRLNGILNTHDEVMSIYNPESYPAINMKLSTNKEYKTSKHTISIFIFGTGNIVITSCKSLSDVVMAYEFIVGTIKLHPEVLKKETAMKIKPDAIVHGYNLRKFISAMCANEL